MKNGLPVATYGLLWLLCVGGTGALAVPVYGNVAQSIAYPTSNGCEYLAAIEGTVRGKSTGYVWSLVVTPTVRCPSGMVDRGRAQVVNGASNSTDALTRALDDAARVVSVHGADRCVYEPELRFDDGEFHVRNVAIACVVDNATVGDDSPKRRR